MVVGSFFFRNLRVQRFNFAYFCFLVLLKFSIECYFHIVLFFILKIYSYVLFTNLCLMMRLLGKKYVVTIMYSVNRDATVQWTLRRTCML